jgi:pectate lyase
VGNGDSRRGVATFELRIAYHHNGWERVGDRSPAGRFKSQHAYNNYYKDFNFQAAHSCSDNHVLAEGNVSRDKPSGALSTYRLVIPDDSPNTRG